MPTAARFVAAIYLAIAGVIVVLVTIKVYPGLERDFLGLAIPVGILGFCMGWWGIGRKIGARNNKTDVGKSVSGLALGLRAGISMFIWSMLMFGFWYMVQGIIAHAYYQPLSAILSMLNTSLAYGKALATSMPIMVTIIVLSLLGGRITKNAWLKWDQSTDLQINR